MVQAEATSILGAARGMASGSGEPLARAAGAQPLLPEAAVLRPANDTTSRPSADLVGRFSAEGFARPSDHLVFRDAGLARRYAAARIPIATLYEAYFDGRLDIPGELAAFLNERNRFVKHSLTREHLQWEISKLSQGVESHSRSSDERSAQATYDERGDEFFRAFLGDAMAFVCGHFDDLGDSLDLATERRHERVCSKIRMRAGQRLLEVGCGWGAFLAHAAQRWGAEGVGVTLSVRQRDYSNRRFARLGVSDRAQAVLADYRDLPDERFDRIVCLETVAGIGAKNLSAFFDSLYQRLSDDGSLLLSWTALRRRSAPEDLMWSLFVNKYILPGSDSALPLSSMLKLAEKSGWHVQSVENLSRHYLRTLARWHENWEANRALIVASHGERWYRIWQFFLVWSQIVGAQGSAACFQVLMSKHAETADRSALTHDWAA